MSTGKKKKIVWVRHTAPDVIPGTCYGQTDVPLKASFEEEASKCAAQLKKYSFQKAYTSPLSRCTRLAGFCGFKEAVHDPRLMEMNFGDWEMKRYDEIDDPYLSRWFDDYLHLPAPNGESLEMQYSRISAFIDDILKKDENEIVVFSHGGSIVCAMIYACMATFENGFSKQPSYGEIVETEF